MKIDLRTVYTQWINLDEHRDNAVQMASLLEEYGFENAHRFPAVRKRADHATRPGEEHYPGVAASQVRCMENILQNGVPGLILEDDVDVNARFSVEFEIPDDADAFYLGTSHGDGRYWAQDIGRGQCRIGSMLSSHAILYTSERYLADLVQIIPLFIEENRSPFDLALYCVQQYFNVYAFHSPAFYQSDAKNNRNKWEELTRKPLRVSRAGE